MVAVPPKPNTWIDLLEVQLEGKKRLTAAEFLRGNPLAPDARLGENP